MILTITLNASIDKRYVVAAAREGEVNRVIECAYTPGGKGLNVASAAALAGAKVMAAGLVGGYAGKYIEAELDKRGINNRFYHLDKESRSCVNIWDKEKGIQTEYLEPGFEVTQAEFETFMEQLNPLVDQADVITVSGSIPGGLDGTAYKRIIYMVKAKNKKVILDTSGELLCQGIEAKPTLIKPNIDEIKMLTGTNCDTKEELIAAAIRLYQSGVAIVVISLGAKGSVVVCGEGIYQARVPVIKAVNTVGCGDAMVAGLAAGLERQYDMVKTIKFASAISAASALREETGFFVKEDMESLLAKIKIIKL